MRLGRQAAFILSLACAFVARAEAQLQLSSVTVVVVDAAGAAVPAATISMSDPLGAEIARAITDGRGRVVFAAVPPGRYAIRTAVAAAPPFDLPLSIEGALPIEMTVRLPGTLSDTVSVEGGSHDEASSRMGLAGESLARTPVRIRGRGLQDALSTLPGWSTEDNGLVHARGVDDGFLYVIDGVPVYERLDALSGFAPDLSGVASVSVVSGYVPPEFGHKAGGVIDVRTASAAAAAWVLDADAALGSDDLFEGSAAAGGPVGAVASLRLGVVSSRSSRFLDPVHPGNLHNTGGQIGMFGQFEWVPSTRDRVTTGWGSGRSRFDVPNNDEQEEAGQDQRQRIGQGYLNATWQRAWAAHTVTHVTAYHRRTTARLDGSPFDTPLEAHADRRLTRSGVLGAATRQLGAHLFKAGFEWQRLSLDEQFTFAITDEEEAEEAEFRDEALQFTRSNPFQFRGRATPRLWSLFVQDAWQLSSRVTLNGGVRFDASRLLLPRSQWSPRVGTAIRVAGDTRLRVALSRFFQPPQPENLLLSSSPDARVLSSIEVGNAVGGAGVEPERQWGFEAGVNHRLGPARLDLAYWRRRIANAADPNVFAGTTIIFPNAVAKGRAHGVEMRIELPRRRGWSGYANWAVSRVVQTGPISGGLFLEDEVEEIGPGVEFSPDHDQRFAAGAGATWTHTGSRLAISLTGRYETGTPVQRDEEDEDELRDRPGAALVDFDAGRVRPRTVISLLATRPVVRSDRLTAVVGVQLLNLFDARYAYNFGNPFSGTHFGAPRTLAVTLRTTFK